MAESKIKTKQNKKPATAETQKKTETQKPKFRASAVTRKASDEKTNNLTVDVYGLDGKVSGSMKLPEEIFGVKVNKSLIAQAVRVYLANQRAGSASTKTRGEVRGSTRKIYRQKGTGRARHGGIRAPIFVHGGIAHGPHPHDFSLDMPQKMKKAALFSVLSLKVKDNAIKIVSELDTITPKTKAMVEMLKNGKLTNKKLLLVLDKKNENVIRAVRNIEGVTYEFANQLHAYEVLNSKTIVFMKTAIDEMKKRV